MILEVQGVSKAFKHKPVLQGVNLALKQGEVCGLLGANGAGKTTLLRIIAGLATPDEGNVRLFGQEKRTSSTMRRMGCFIQRPCLYSSMSARENLLLQQTLLGVPQDKTEALLAQIGLADTGTKKVAKFSQGMKQRLGIGMALLGSPDLLLLDEPVNSMDPQGVYEMRGLLKGLCEEGGVTILIASHMLDEVSRLATCYAFLRDGEVNQVSREEMQQQTRSYAHLITDNPNATAVVLERFLPGENGYEVLPDGSFRLYAALDRLGEINAALVGEGIGVTGLSQRSMALEAFFLQATGKGEHHA